jgi:alkylhydroperoxidase family enzyme
VPRIDVPADQDPLIYLWTQRAQSLAPRAGAFSDAVYKRSTLPLREFEAARITIARINDCQLCLGFRTPRDVPERANGEDVDEAFYDAVLTWSSGDGVGLTAREALAAEFAERFAIDHRNMDDELWQRLHEAFTDDELVELALCVGAWIAFGRLNQVFDVDGGCRVPLAP